MNDQFQNMDSKTVIFFRNWKRSFNVYNKFWTQSEFCRVPLQRQLSPIAWTASVSDIPDELHVLNHFPYCSRSQNLLCVMNFGGKHAFSNNAEWMFEIGNFRKSSVQVGSSSEVFTLVLYEVAYHWNFVGAKLKMAENLEKDNVSTTRKPSTSLVTDVLLKSGRLEKEDINSCVKKTLQKSEEVKASYIPHLAGSSVDSKISKLFFLFKFCFRKQLIYLLLTICYFLYFLWFYSRN